MKQNSQEKEFGVSKGSGSGVKYFLHRQSTLSATLFIAQAETAELTAVMSHALMECFVPRSVRMLPGFCVSCEGKLGAGAKMADSCPIFFPNVKKAVTISLHQVVHGP